MKRRTTIAIAALCGSLPLVAQAQTSAEVENVAVETATEAATEAPAEGPATEAAAEAVEAPATEAAEEAQDAGVFEEGDELADADCDTDCDRDADADCDQDRQCDRTSLTRGDWMVDFGGYVRAGYRGIQEDSNLEAVGEHNGFMLHNVRVGMEVEHEIGFSAVVSLEAAASPFEHADTPEAELFVQLKDGYVRHQPTRYMGIQVGQFKAPWAQEELNSTGRMLFVDRAVGFTGVSADQGNRTQSLELDRQIGLMIDSGEAIELGDFRLGYAFMIANGNGPNQLKNDNRSMAMIGRLTLGYQDLFQVGVGAYKNNRTVNAAPNRTEEQDLGVAADLAVSAFGANLQGQLAWVQTEFPTIGEETSEALAAHVQISYDIDLGFVTVTPGYRYAYFDPYFGAEDGDPTNRDNLGVQHHTFGAKLDMPSILNGSGFSAEYTVAAEEEGREVSNNQFDLLFYTNF